MSAEVLTRSLTEVMNKTIANLNVMYVKLHHYHWFVKGPAFYELHRKFEELYKQMASYIDELAERVLAIKGVPVSTMKAFLQNCSIMEAAGNETPEQMIKTLAGDFRTMIDEIQQGIKMANETNDDSTADILIGIRTYMEKQAWMFDAYLAK